MKRLIEKDGRGVIFCFNENLRNKGDNLRAELILPTSVALHVLTIRPVQQWYNDQITQVKRETHAAEPKWIKIINSDDLMDARA